MPLGMEAGLGSRDFVFDGDPGNPWKKGKLTPRPILAHAYHGQTAEWTKMPLGTAQATLCYMGSQLPSERGTALPQFSFHVYCGYLHYQ